MSNLSNPIRIYEMDLTLVGELDDYANAYFTRSWYGAGAFSIQTNWNTVHATDLAKDRIVMFAKDSHRCGLITTIEKKVDENGKGGEIITASGFELPYIFSWRITLPMAGSTNWQMTTAAETVMKELIKDQCGADAVVNRRFSGLTLATDLARGIDYTLNTRFVSTVYDALKQVSQATELGYFISIDENTGLFTFEVSQGVDRTASQGVNPRAIFSKEFDTLKQASFLTSDNQYRNFAYTAGQGVGVLRNIRTGYNTPVEPTGFDRKEVYIDARDLSADVDLDARALQRLEELNIQTTVNGMPLTYSPLVYRTDYDLGDMVTIAAFDVTYDARITEVKESWTPLSYNIDAIFDKQPLDLSSQINRAFDNVKSNLAQTEGTMDQEVKKASNSTFASVILSNLTASLAVVSDAGKKLVSLAYTGATSLRKNLGLETTDSPTFAGVHTTRVDNSGGALLLNTSGGDVTTGPGNFESGGTIRSKRSGGDGAVFIGPLDTFFYSTGANLDVYINGLKKIGISSGGYTQLGSDAGAPSIKMKKLTGTTAGTQGGITSTAHGLTSSKILSVALAINYSGTAYISSHSVYTPGYEVEAGWTSSNVDVLNITGNSINILSKPFTILITYEE